MKVQLKTRLRAGTTHEQRLAAAGRIADLCLAKHGEKIAAVCVYGSTAIGDDLPFSDLDMTVLTTEDLGAETKCYTHEGLTVNLDYQTVEETICDEAEVAFEGGCWEEIQVLMDPGGVVDDVRERYRRLTGEDHDREFAKLMADQLSTDIGKLRNAVLAEDRAHFLESLQEFGKFACRAVCLLNRSYVTSERRMLPACREFEHLPELFSEHIDRILGVVKASDQDRYDSAEGLWEGLKGMAAERRVRWCEEGLTA